MAKRISILLTIICILLAGILVQKFLTQDRNGPVITFEDEEQDYSPSMSEEQLLEGVKAMDAEDGDVSRSLRVESVTDLNNGKVSVIYVAKDSVNNVTKRQRLIPISGPQEAAKRAADSEDDILVNEVPSSKAAGTSAESSLSRVTDVPDAGSIRAGQEMAAETLRQETGGAEADEFANEAYEEVEE